MPELHELAFMPTGPGQYGVADGASSRSSIQDRLRRILSRMLDENEFLSPYGIRSLSRFHAEHPYIFWVNGQEYRVDYLPAESDTRHVRRQLQLARPGLDAGQRAASSARCCNYYLYYGDNFKIECPTGSGNLMNLFEVGQEIANRLTRIFLRDDKRAATGLWRMREIPNRSSLAGLHSIP